MRGSVIGLADLNPADLQINLDAKSKPVGQNGLILNKDINILSN